MVEVRIDLTNRGDTAAQGVSVEAELLGRRDAARLPADLPPSATGRALVRFEVGAPPPGVFALALHLRYTPAGATAVEASQRAYLLLALGANPPPPVRLAVADVRLETAAPVVVRIESADGRPHRVRLRLLAPRGLQPFGPEPEAQVPAAGPVSARLEVLRGSAPRRSRQGVVVLAETVGEDVAGAAAATAVVEVQSDPAWLPHLRRPLAAAAAILLAAAAGLEVGRRRRRPSAPGD